MNTTTKQHVRTVAGTVHAHTVGRAFKQYGVTYRNAAGERIGRADCGAQTSGAATITADAVTCAKCAARAS